MIISKICGGLGNQMFQYSFAKYLSKINYTELWLDTSYFHSKDNYLNRKFQLDVFNVSYRTVTSMDLKYVLFPYRKKILRNTLLKVFKNDKIISYIKEPNPNFNSVYLKLPDNIYLSGFWQSEKYFAEISDEIRNEFSFRYPYDYRNKEYLDLIEKDNSVSIHIRRKDYVNDPTIHKFHGICSMDYYNRSMEYIKMYIKHPVFFIFSDEPEWAKKHFPVKSDFVYIDFNMGARSYEDLRLMTSCKHNIIANSSFSWWAAWLNNYPQKKVVAPSKWFRNPVMNACNIIPEKWIKL